MSTDPTQPWTSTQAAERWQRMAAQRQQAVGAATDRMFEAVALEPGFGVLDLAAGTGDTTIVAARRVGTAGHVTRRSRRIRWRAEAGWLRWDFR